MVFRSLVATLSETKRPSSGTHRRRRWMLTFCQRFVWRLECDTLQADIRRLPVISLLAMRGGKLAQCLSSRKRELPRDETSAKLERPKPCHESATVLL